jgi:hypothetical protein
VIARWWNWLIIGALIAGMLWLVIHAPVMPG